MLIATASELSTVEWHLPSHENRWYIFQSCKRIWNNALSQSFSLKNERIQRSPFCKQVTKQDEPWSEIKGSPLSKGWSSCWWWLLLLLSIPGGGDSGGWWGGEKGVLFFPTDQLGRWDGGWSGHYGWLSNCPSSDDSSKPFPLLVIEPMSCEVWFAGVV